MSGFLLDTNCISEVVSVKPDSHVLAWLDAAEERTLYLSALTLGEIRKGIVTLVEGRRRTQLEAWLARRCSEFPAQVDNANGAHTYFDVSPEKPAERSGSPLPSTSLIEFDYAAAKR